LETGQDIDMVSNRPLTSCVGVELHRVPNQISDLILERE
jgi:hypothetical protein